MERCHRQSHATRDDAQADVFHCIERFYHLTRRHSSLGNQSPIDFERQKQIALLAVHRTRRSSSLLEPRSVLSIEFVSSTACFLARRLRLNLGTLNLTGHTRNRRCEIHEGPE